MGAGSIGCWLGGRLAAAGVPVHFVGRPRVLQALREHGLTLTDRDGGHAPLPPTQLSLHEVPPPRLAPALVLLCVKSGGTADAARQLAAALPAGTPVVSMQNGLSNVPSAQAAAPALQWIAGMVPYNIAEVGPGRFHRGTSGLLAAQDHPALRAWQAAFDRAGLPLALHADLRSVQWGKLLLNLNNAVNALSGLPLRAQLLDADLRLCTAALIEETLALLAAAGIVPAKMSPLPPAWVPRVMRLPTPLFRLVASGSLRIDAQARSSMADDLALGRPTEIDALQGEVIRLARSLGRAAPLNERISALVKAWPERRQPCSGRALREALGIG
ncbi:2-dehydropantoate 2-reductase [Aquabacterium sp.]|uniref:2-dehydropantoate 2-reductase n=1 Tax=Aquabacterium sp. TaxID=1872578 RepID=UPI0037852588